MTEQITADDGIKELSGILPTINEALGYGINMAANYCKSHDKEQRVDPYLAPDLTRFHVKKVLEDAGYTVTNIQGEVNIGLKQIPNNGLLISFGKFNLRILKSNNGTTPVPGKSKVKQEYYNQLNIFNTTEIKDSKINLILLWEVDSAWDLSELLLVYPKAGGLTKKSVEIFWQVSIPESILIPSNPLSKQYIPNTVPDLPITLKPNMKERENLG